MRLRTFMPAAALAAASAAGAAPADINVISKVEVQNAGGSVVVSIRGSRPPNFTTFSMMDPPRFVIDFSESGFQGVPEDLPVGDGTIKGIKNLSYGSEATSIARVMIAFEQEVDAPDVQTSGATLLVKVTKPAGAPVAQAEPPDAARRKAYEEKAGSAPQPKPQAEAPAAAAARALEEAPAKAEPEKTQVRAAEAKARPEAEAQPAQPGSQGKAEAEAARAPSPPAAAAPAAQQAEAERARQESQARAEREAQARAAAEEAAREPARAEVRAQLEREAKGRADAEARAKAEEEARAAAEAQRKAEAEAMKAEAEAAARPEPKPLATLMPPPSPQPEERAPASLRGRPAQVQEIGFRLFSEASRVFVRTSSPPRFTVQEAGENLIRVEFADTRVKHANDARFLDTSFFPSAVAMVTPKVQGSSYIVEIKLKERVPYQQKLEGDMIAIDFERPASMRSGAKPGAAAPAAEPEAEGSNPGAAPPGGEDQAAEPAPAGN